MLNKLVQKSLIISFLVLTQVGVAQDTSHKAVKQYELGLFVQASFSLEKYLAKGEVDKMFYAMLADCYDKMNAPEKVVEVLEKMDSEFDLTTDELMLWGQNLKKLEYYDAAKAVYTRLEKLDADLARYLKATCEVEDLKVLAGQTTIHTLPINTERSEFGPTFFNEKLVFSSSRDDILRSEQVNAVDRNAFQNQLYQVNVNPDTKWMSNPTFLRSDLKDYYNNGPVSFAPEAGIAVFAQNHFIDGQTQINPKEKSVALYIAEIDERGDWEKTYSFPHNGIGYSNVFPHLADGGKTLYFASNRPGGEGGYDLYVSSYVNNEWTEPRNLGTVVNSVGDEVSPYLNDQYLYFSSNWHRGLGGFDVFRVEKDESFQVIEHLGKGINSSRDDYGLIFGTDPNTGFFTSNRTGGNGLEDIYGFTLAPKARFAAVLEGENKMATAPLPDISAREEESETAKVEAEIPDDNLETITASYETEEVLSATETEIVPYTGQELGEDEKKVTVYSIQVAAFSKDWGGYDKLADDLADIGRVYKVYYANMIKIRVGSFKRESDARSALAKVKQRGYKDAFLVREELVVKTVPKNAYSGVKEMPNDSRSGEVSAEKEMQQEDKTGVLRSQPVPPKDEEFQIDEERLKDMPVYRIRVAAYTNPEWFNKKKVAHLGDIHKDQQGEWHIFYVGDFKTIEEAEKVKIQVKDAGYNAAQLYMLRDGELIKVR